MKPILSILFCIFGCFLASTMAVGTVTENKEKFTKFLPIQPIPGTDLFSGVFYTVGMKSFPEGWVTWNETNVPEGDGHFAVMDRIPDNLPLYQLGGKRYNDNQWVFELKEGSGENQYYTLINKGQKNSVLTTRNGYRLVVVDEKSPNLFLNESFLKPTMSEEKDYYQIKLPAYPQGVVTWMDPPTTKIYERFLQVSTNVNHRPLYQPGGKWYVHTLFGFNPRQSDWELFGNVIKFETMLDPKNHLHVYNTTKRTLESKIMVPQSDVPTIIPVNYNIEHSLELDIVENLKSFKELNMLVHLPDDVVFETFKHLVQQDNAKIISHSAKKMITETVIIDPQMSPVTLYSYKDVAENIKMPFKALVSVQAFADRLLADHSGVEKGPIPPQMAISALQQAGFSQENLVVSHDSVMVMITGTLQGSIVTGYGVTTEKFMLEH